MPDQIKTIDKRLPLREKIAQRYEIALKDTKISFPKIRLDIIHSRHLFPINVGVECRDYALSMLGKLNIGATVNYRAISTMKYYSEKYSFNGDEHPVSSVWGNGTISIPLFPGITEQEQDYVIDILTRKINKLIGDDK